MQDSQTKPDQERLKGEVVSWVPSPAYGYHGYIRCDNQSKIPGLVLVNSTLLRDPGGTLSLGDHVNFKPVPVARGYLAKDVVVLTEDTDAYEGADTRGRQQLRVGRSALYQPPKVICYPGTSGR